MVALQNCPVQETGTYLVIFLCFETTDTFDFTGTGRPPGHSSDSEDQSRIASLPHKSHKARPTASTSSSPPSHGKDGKHSASPQRMYKWTLQLGKLPAERLCFASLSGSTNIKVVFFRIVTY